MQGQIREADYYEQDVRDKIQAEMQEQMRDEIQEQMRDEMQEQMLALKQPLEAVPSPQHSVSTHVQTPPYSNAPNLPLPAVAVEPNRRSVCVKHVKQRN